MAAAAPFDAAGWSSPQAAATARHRRGRMRAPRGNTACRIAAAEQRRSTRSFGLDQRGVQCPLDPGDGIHGAAPCLSTCVVIADCHVLLTHESTAKLGKPGMGRNHRSKTRPRRLVPVRAGRQRGGRRRLHGGWRRGSHGEGDEDGDGRRDGSVGRGRPGVRRSPRVILGPDPMGAKIAWRAAGRPPLYRHGPARPDHLPEQAGENEFGETDGPVEPDHDVL